MKNIVKKGIALILVGMMFLTQFHSAQAADSWHGYYSSSEGAEYAYSYWTFGNPDYWSDTYTLNIGVGEIVVLGAFEVDDRSAAFSKNLDTENNAYVRGSSSSFLPKFDATKWSMPVNFSRSNGCDASFCLVGKKATPKNKYLSLKLTSKASYIEDEDEIPEVEIEIKIHVYNPPTKDNLKILGNSSVKKGKTIQLKTQNRHSNMAKWRSSNTSILKVAAGGKVTGVKAGTAYVYLKTYNNIIVKKKIKVTK